MKLLEGPPTGVWEAGNHGRILLRANGSCSAWITDGVSEVLWGRFGFDSPEETEVAIAVATLKLSNDQDPNEDGMSDVNCLCYTLKVVEHADGGSDGDSADQNRY